MLTRKVLIVIMFVLLAGCASANIRNQADKLSSALNLYGSDMRWGRMNYAHRYHVRRDGTQPEFNIELQEKYNVTSVRPIEPVINEDATAATVPIEIDYYDKEYGTLRTLKEIQNWWFDPEAKRWLVESDFPAFK